MRRLSGLLGLLIIFITWGCNSDEKASQSFDSDSSSENNGPDSSLDSATAIDSLAGSTDDSSTISASTDSDTSLGTESETNLDTAIQTISTESETNLDTAIQTISTESETNLDTATLIEVDECPNNPAKTVPGICGCGLPEVDGDGDGTLDCVDDCPADPLKISAGICGCGVSDIDSNGNNTADCNDNANGQFCMNAVRPSSCQTAHGQIGCCTGGILYKWVNGEMTKTDCNAVGKYCLWFSADSGYGCGNWEGWDPDKIRDNMCCGVENAYDNCRCGDGIVDSEEECDDGNDIDGDGCTACNQEAFVNCAGEPSVCDVIDLGAFEVNTSVPTQSDTLDGGSWRYYWIHVNDYLLLSGTLSALSGDPDFYLFDATTTTVYSDTMSGNAAIYTNVEPGTYVIGIFASSDDTIEYSLNLSFFEQTCGDGIFDPLEECDDGNDSEGDGCSSCAVDPFYECDGSSPSVCLNMLENVDSFVADGGTSFTTLTGSLSAGTSRFFQITFTENVVVNGTLAGSTGDPDFGIFSEDGANIYSAAKMGDESVYTDLNAGKYIVEIFAWGTEDCAYSLDLLFGNRICGDGNVTPSEACDDGNAKNDDGCTACAIDEGYQCTSSTPSVCSPSIIDLGIWGVNATIPEQNGIVDGENSDYYMIEIAGDLALSATLSATSGDPDFYLYTMDKILVGSAKTTGDEDTYLPLNAGQYLLEVRNRGVDPFEYALNMVVVPQNCGNGVLNPGEKCDDGNEFNEDGCYQCNVEASFVCEFEPSVCKSIYPSLGIWGAGATIPAQSVELAESQQAAYSITFSTAVLLDGMVSAPASAGNPYLFVFNESMTTMFAGVEREVSVVLEAGTYTLVIANYNVGMTLCTIALVTSTPEIFLPSPSFM